MNARLRLLAAIVLLSPMVGLSQPRLPVIGMIALGMGPKTSNPGVAQVLEGLREQGYIDGQNLRLEARFAEGRIERIPLLARELAALKVDIMWVVGQQGVEAATAASATIPIVSFSCDRPEGIALARPGGRVTGVTCMQQDLNRKRVELLRELVPRLSRIAVLYNPLDSTKRGEFGELRASLNQVPVSLLPFEASDPEQFEKVFAAIGRSRPGALLVLDDAFTFVSVKAIASFAARYRLPSIFGFSEYVAVGGLASYGPDSRRLARRSADYIVKILKGEDPGKLPIELPTQFDLVLNAKTATALGVVIPKAILLRADRVIE